MYRINHEEHVTINTVQSCDLHHSIHCMISEELATGQSTPITSEQEKVDVAALQINVHVAPPAHERQTRK